MSEAAAPDLSSAHRTDVGEGVLARALTDTLQRLRSLDEVQDAHARA